MSLTTVFLALLPLGLAAAARGPLTEAHDVLGDSFINTQEENIHEAPQAIQGVPHTSVMEEAARGVLPPPLWDTLFYESPDTLVTNHDSKPRAEPQTRAGLLGLLAPYYLPGGRNVSGECRQDVSGLSEGFISGKFWALKVVDSWGKFPDGVLVGNLWTPGLLDECLRTTVDSEDPKAHFSGRYCSFAIGMKENETNPQQLLWGEGEYNEYENYEEDDEYKAELVRDLKIRKMMLPNLHMADVKGVLQIAIRFNLLATCIPSTCTEEEYRQSLEKQLDERNLTLSLLACQTRELPSLRYNTADICMIVALSLLGATVVVGTGADVWITLTRNETLARGPLRYVLVFSFYTNLPKIFRINTNESEEVISCLHGIRVLTMVWVVMGHAFLISFFFSPNKGYIAQMIAENPYSYQLIFNAFPSVDTFFFMSGLLVAYNLTKEFQRTSRFNIPLYYIHRVIRLCPPILLLCGFFAVFPPLFVQGSLSPLMVRRPYLVDSCIRHWWRDSFLITNMFTGTEDGGSCLPVCWYTAVDFQLYIVAPFMILPLLYRRKPGMVVLGVLLLVSVVVPMTIIGVNQLPPTNVVDARQDDSALINKLVYMKPWCRASPYLVGLALGYFMRVVDKNKVQLKWWQVGLGWILALVIMGAVVFGVKDYNTFTGKVHEYNAAASILYGGFNRLAWGLAIAWLVFACHMGYGGLANSFLAHHYWQPISRLTYSIFLIALNVQSIYYIFYARMPSYYTPFYKLIETAGILLVAGLGGVLLSLLAESPVLGFEKLLLGRGRERPDPLHSRISSTSGPIRASSLTSMISSPSSSTHESSPEEEEAKEEEEE